MVEYRVQIKRNGHWQFVYDRKGKPYTYESVDAALRYGPGHYPIIFAENGKYSRDENHNYVHDYSRGRIVKVNLEVTVVDLNNPYERA